jgi:hypothetical protein
MLASAHGLAKAGAARSEVHEAAARQSVAVPVTVATRRPKRDSFGLGGGSGGAPRQHIDRVLRSWSPIMSPVSRSHPQEARP